MRTDREIENQAELEPLLVGRTIVRAEMEPSSGLDWQHGENTVTLWLDDGSRVEFLGDGYDASACITTYYPADQPGMLLLNPRQES